MKSNWMDKQVSLYNAHWDNVGRAATYRDIILSDFAQNMNTIMQLRKMNKDDHNYNANKVALKSELQCFTPAALLACKAKDNVQVIERTGMMQLDFDYKDIKEYDIEELKQCEEQLSVCEGSDWFWWLGDYNAAGSASSFDQLYRRNLTNLYLLLKQPVPASLASPISMIEIAPSANDGISDIVSTGSMKRGTEN